MDTEEDTVLNGETCEKMVQFVSVIEKFPILLEKSNIADVKRKKANAVSEIKGAISAGVRSCGTEVAEVSLEQSEIQLEVHGSFITSGTGSVKIIDSDYAMLRTSKTSSMGSRRVNSGPLKNQQRKEKLPETEETKNLTTQVLQRLVLLEQLQVFRLTKEMLLQKKQQNDMKQLNSNTQADAIDAVLHIIPDNENIDENFPIFLNL
ncbi:hypothetical protein FQR65_LT07982 [Abscondita terminalis]|nr:hypothetical protein FQR65_LT07982 [Abscondita terminalis]